MNSKTNIPILGEFEHLILLAILRLNDNAYGVAIRRELTARAKRETTPGALYTTLDRLEEKGLISSRLGESTPERGGRAKRYFTVSASGLRAIAHAQKAYQRMLSGLHIPGLANT